MRGTRGRVEIKEAGYMKLLLITSDTFPPFRVDVSVLFGREMSSRGHKIDWLLQSREPCDKAYLASWEGGCAWVGPTDVATSRLGRLRKHVRGWIHDLRLREMVRTNGYDIVQVKDKFVSALPAIVAARRGGLKFVYWLSFPFPEESLYAAKAGLARYPFVYWLRGHFLRWLLYRVIVPSADHVFVQSAQMKKDIVAMGGDPGRITAVPMGVSTELLSSYEEHDVWPGAIVYLGTFNSARRLDFLVRVFALVRQRVRDARLYMVGAGDDPEDERALEEECLRLGVDSNVVFTGFLPRNEALGYVRRAAVCVSPFFPTPILNSTSPTKLIEYMALGRAVVANDHPEQRSVIGESGGGICVSYDESEFSRAICSLLENPHLAADMGRRGREYVARNRTYRRIADAVESQYGMILETERTAGFSSVNGE